MNTFTDQNFYKNIYLINSSDSAQHEMNFITDQNFYKNIYLINSSQLF